MFHLTFERFSVKKCSTPDINDISGRSRTDPQGFLYRREVCLNVRYVFLKLSQAVYPLLDTRRNNVASFSLKKAVWSIVTVYKYFSVIESKQYI